jgi:hypothetical protein
MKKTIASEKSRTTRRGRRRLPGNSGGAAPDPSSELSAVVTANPESVALWQQLNAVESVVAPRYRRD